MTHMERTIGLVLGSSDTWSCPTLGLACVLMSRPISPELVLSPDFWISNIPRYFTFATALYRPFLQHYTLTNKVVGTLWRALSKTPSRRQRPDLRPLRLLVGTPSAIRPELASRRAEHSLSYSDVAIYIFITYAVCVLIVMPSPLGVAVGLVSL